LELAKVRCKKRGNGRGSCAEGGAIATGAKGGKADSCAVHEARTGGRGEEGRKKGGKGRLRHHKAAAATRESGSCRRNKKRLQLTHRGATRPLACLVERESREEQNERNDRANKTKKGAARTEMKIKQRQRVRERERVKGKETKHTREQKRKCRNAKCCRH
jgi:hypothetical protein